MMQIGNEKVVKVMRGANTLWEKPEWTPLNLPDRVTGAAIIKRDELDGGYWLTGVITLIPVKTGVEATSLGMQPILQAPAGYKFNDFMHGSTGTFSICTNPNSAMWDTSTTYEVKYHVVDGVMVVDMWPHGNQAQNIQLNSALWNTGNVYDKTAYSIKVQLIKED